jgi:hypothetical protein
VSEIAPYDDEELNEYGLRLRCRDLRAESARLAARVKVLEEALCEVANATNADGSDCWCLYQPREGEGHTRYCRDATAALAAKEET